MPFYPRSNKALTLTIAALLHLGRPRRTELVLLKSNCTTTEVVTVRCDAIVTQFVRATQRLCNSATGGGRAIGPFAEMDVDGFKNSFAKLWGYSHVLRFGIDKMAKDGSIVLVSGTPARRCKPGLVALSAVGGAVEALVRAVAPEIAPIRLNVVSPGFIDTPMVSLSGAERVAHYEKLTKDHAIARAGTADEVADAILFAIQNDFVTGTTIDVDGGWLLS